MDFSILSVVLVLVVAFLAGIAGILDQFQLHKTIISCSIVGLPT